MRAVGVINNQFQIIETRHIPWLTGKKIFSPLYLQLVQSLDYDIRLLQVHNSRHIALRYPHSYLDLPDLEDLGYLLIIRTSSLRPLPLSH